MLVVRPRGFWPPAPRSPASSQLPTNHPPPRPTHYPATRGVSRATKRGAFGLVFVTGFITRPLSGSRLAACATRPTDIPRTPLNPIYPQVRVQPEEAIYWKVTNKVPGLRFELQQVRINLLFLILH